MKNYLSNRTTLGLTAASILSLVSGGLAQDPFIKEKKKRPQIESSNEERRAPSNLLTQIEFIEVPKDKATAFASDPGFGSDGTELRKEVQKWIEDGSASIVDIGLVSTRSGQRAMIASIRELITPTEWETETSIPSSFETYNTGTTIELDSVSSPGGSVVDFNLTPEIMTDVGESPAIQRPNWFQEGDVFVPLFYRMKSSSAVTSVDGSYVLLDVGPASENEDRRSVLSFARAATMEAVLQDKDSDSESIESYGLNVTAEWFDVPTSELGKWLFEQELGSVATSAYSVAKDWQKSGLATIANLASIQTRSGQRCKTESVSHVIYATEYLVPKNGIPRASAYETRYQGSTFEIDPVNGPDDISVNVSAEMVRLVGNSVCYRHAERPIVTMPIFYTTQVTTAVSLQPGEPTLVGIMTPYGENGRPNPLRKLLLFISARR